MRSRHLACVIGVAPEAVYAFASDPDNLPAWSAGLAQSEVTRHDDVLTVDSPMGRVIVRFVPRNEFGIVDHDVTLPSGVTINNPFRVMVHPDGSEVLFTVRQIAMTDEEFERDCTTVLEDLARLKMLLEAWT